MPPSLRARQTAETRNELIKAGTRLFGSKGYANVSAVNIVEKAGVTRGALYHHFSDGKPGLFKAVVENIQKAIVKALEDSYKLEKPTPDILSDVVHGYFKIFENKAYRQILLQDAPSVLGWRALRDIDKEYSLKFIADRLRELQSRGEIKDLPADMMAASFIAAACEASLMMFQAKGKAKIAAEQDAIKVIMTLAGGLLP